MQAFLVRLFNTTEALMKKLSSNVHVLQISVKLEHYQCLELGNYSQSLI